MSQATDPKCESGVTTVEPPTEEKAKMLEALVARLKTEDAVDDQKHYGEGKQAGERWARKKASRRQFQRLARWSESDSPHTTSDWLAFFGEGMIGRELFVILHPQEGHDRSDVDGFWERAIGDDGPDLIEDADFAEGFVDSALEIWCQVKDQI